MMLNFASCVLAPLQSLLTFMSSITPLVPPPFPVPRLFICVMPNLSVLGLLAPCPLYLGRTVMRGGITISKPFSHAARHLF